MYSPQKNDDRYKKNYIDLEKKSLLPHSQKVEHMERILEKKSLQKQIREDIPQFLQLIFEIRCYCIAVCYFPEGSKYQKIFGNYHCHPGWKDNMTKRERKMLFCFKRAAEDIEKNSKDVSQFNKTDEIFGKYRYSKWLESKNSEKN